MKKILIVLFIVLISCIGFGLAFNFEGSDGTIALNKIYDLENYDEKIDSCLSSSENFTEFKSCVG